jgi:negative regulator of sigma E activity
MNDAIRMQISAFVDGELPDAEADLLLRRMSQDADLRKQAAEFLEIGRAMRGEPGVPGVERLQERVSAALNDRPMAADEVLPELPAERSIRPLVGVAVAASVALLAIVGLQFSPGLDGPGAATPAGAVAEVDEDTTYVVPPRPVDDQLRQYVMSHGASASELGGNSMNARLVTLRLSEEALAEEESEDEAAEEDAADPMPTQQ